MDYLLAHHALRGREHNRRRELRFQRRHLRDVSNSFTLPEVRFVELFRFPQFWVLHLIEILEPHLNIGVRISAIPVHLKVLAALNFFGTGSYQRNVGEDYHIAMSQTVVSRCVTQITRCIEQYLLPRWVKFPITNQEKTIIKQTFMLRSRIPGVLGAIDCTHIRILKPSIEDHNYYNRKVFYSKNVQIICDFNLVILNINARHAGSTHDAHIWQTSEARNHMRRNYDAGNGGSWLLGDSGYPLEPWLMTPILNAAPGSPEERYTNAHCRARVCVERLNGVLKGVFRCLGEDRLLRYTPQKAGSIINTCAVLHNMRRHLNINDENIDVQNINLAAENDAPPQDLNLLHEGRRIRNSIVDRLQ